MLDISRISGSSKRFSLPPPDLTSTTEKVQKESTAPPLAVGGLTTNSPISNSPPGSPGEARPDISNLIRSLDTPPPSKAEDMAVVPDSSAAQ